MILEFLPRILKDIAKISNFHAKNVQISTMEVYKLKGTQNNLSQVSIECIDKVLLNALILFAR